jgi:hypothetical protein
MLNKTFALAALTGAALLAAAPAFADGYRHGHNQRVVVVQQYAPQYAHRSWRGDRRPAYRHAVVYRPVVARPAPVVVYRQHSSHDVLGGLILGAMIGAVIANHAGY